MTYKYRSNSNIIILYESLVHLTTIQILCGNGELRHSQLRQLYRDVNTQCAVNTINSYCWKNTDHHPYYKKILRIRVYTYSETQVRVVIDFVEMSPSSHSYLSSSRTNRQMKKKVVLWDKTSSKGISCFSWGASGGSFIWYGFQTRPLTDADNFTGRNRAEKRGGGTPH